MNTLTQIPDITDPKVRLGIYERALEMLESKCSMFSLHKDNGLCLWLPCLWLNPNDYVEDWFDHDGRSFQMRDVPKYFPEFGRYYPSDNYERTREYRISILTQIIKNLKEKV